MLALTQRSLYALSALLELAENYGDKLVQVKDISNKHNIPKHFLDQILNRLKQSGFVRSVQGAKGGYTFAYNPSELQVLTVLETLEGELSLYSGHQPRPSVVDLLKKTEDRIRESFQITLAELCEREKQRRQDAMYYI